MRTFDYSHIPPELLSVDVMSLLADIHEFKGRQHYHLNVHSDALASLSLVARIQSTDASNRIEGIYTSNTRLRSLMNKKTAPRNRNEEEIAGYRDVLALVHSNYASINLTPNVILQLHRDLYRYSAKSFAGQWKTVDNQIVEVDSSGNRIIRFSPPSAVATPALMDELCAAYQLTATQPHSHSLLSLLMFIFDLTCIHPFNDGNGRISRLLTLLLMYQQGYDVGKYISLESQIERTKDSYYDALAESSIGWESGQNSYLPFVRYMLGIVLGAYKELAQRVDELSQLSTSKQDRVRLIFDSQLGVVTKADIMLRYPDISQTTVERALKSLLDAGYVMKTGSGPSTGYIRASQ